jgi:hypothetical protein
MIFPLIDLSTISADLALASYVAITLGVIFVIFQLRQNNRMIKAATAQAQAAASQSNLTTAQLKLDRELANMDMVMRLYEFANSAEVQSSWLTVLARKVSSFEEFEKLQKAEQISFFQIAALFESLGILVERGFVKLEIIDDMFVTPLAWESLKPFVTGMRQKYGDVENYVYFEKLYNDISKAQTKEEST